MDVMDGDFKMMVKYLFRVIGRPWVAYCAGLESKFISTKPDIIFNYKRAPLDVELRLRYTYQVVLLVKEAYGKKMLMGWLFDRNPNLNWSSPADVLRYSNKLSKLSRVIEVARKFVISR